MLVRESFALLLPVLLVVLLSVLLLWCRCQCCSCMLPPSPPLLPPPLHDAAAAAAASIDEIAAIAGAIGYGAAARCRCAISVLLLALPPLTPLPCCPFRTSRWITCLKTRPSSSGRIASTHGQTNRCLQECVTESLRKKILLGPNVSAKQDQMAESLGFELKLPNP